MSVALFQYDRDIYDDDAKLILSEPIVSQRFYNLHWERAVQELGIYYLQDGAQFDYIKKDAVMQEVHSLLSWADKNLHGVDFEYMKSRLENLLQVISQALKNEDAVLYIF